MGEKDVISLPTLIEGVSVLSKIIKDVETNQNLTELKNMMAQNGTIQVILELLRDCKLEKEGRIGNELFSNFQFRTPGGVFLRFIARFARVTLKLSI